MRIARRNLVLGAGLAILALAHWLAASGREEREIVRLFPELVPSLARSVTIESGDGARRVELVLQEGEWVLPDAFGHRARANAVPLLLDRIASLTDVDLVADRALDHADYGVGEGAIALRIQGAGGAPLAALAQGKEAPAGPGDLSRATFVRPLGRDGVFRASRLARLELDLLAWLDNRWLDLDPGAVEIVRLRGAELGPGAAVERARERGWSGTTRELLDFARGMFFEAVVGREAPIAGAVLEIELVLAEGRTITLTLGERAEDGTRLAWRSDEPFVVRFAKAMVDPLVERARAVAGRKQ